MSEIRALVVRGPREISLETRPAPSPSPGELMIRPLRVGVCGTDLDIIDGTIDPAFVRYPLVLGHEWSGELLSAPAAGPLTVGDTVVVEGVVPCGHCAACTAGDTNRCENYDEFGFVRDGAMCELLVAPARLVHRLAPEVSLESGALVEPAAVVLRALLKAAPRPGERVLVIGDGTVALLAVTLARLWSPGSVTMLGRRPAQSGLARLAGADHFETDAGAVGTGYSLVIEAAGAGDAVRTAIAAPARGGRIVLIGFPGHGVEVPLPIDDLVNNDLTVLGSFSYTSAAWRRLVELLNAGRLDLGYLVTHRFALARWAEAIETLRHGEGARGKVLIEL